jgi:Xaa-Pro aminopeptidase
MAMMKNFIEKALASFINSSDFHDDFDAVLIINNGIYPQEKRLKYLLNFDGSYGIAYFVFAKKTLEKKSQDNNLEKIVLFLDGRYFEEFSQFARKNNSILQVLHIKEAPNWLEKFYKERNEKLNIATDLNLFSHSYISSQKQKFPHLKYHHLNRNLINADWTESFDNINAREIISIPDEQCGESFFSKINRLFCKHLQHHHIYHQIHLIHDSESIAWLLNLRSKSMMADLPGILIITINEVILFSNQKIIDSIEKNFNKQNNTQQITLKNIDQFQKWIQNYCQKDIEILTDTESGLASLIRFLGSYNIQHQNNPCILAKSIKNATEIENIKNAHKYDGAAVVKFMYWMQNQYHNKNQITEIEAAEKLYQIKSSCEKFICNSFDTILGGDENSANIHGKPSDKIINKFYLLDSGGQYLYGTTDMTRTVSLSTPSNDRKLHYTLVLKGHIAIASAKIIKGTTGSQIDIIARQYLWQHGLDYPHSTGHGVGFLLNVHEGPQGISVRNNVVIQEGMILSNEPGYYIPQKYGMRIENLILTKQSQYEDYLEFETISFAPLCSNLIDMNLLTKSEIDWLQKYHEKVVYELKDLLSQDEKEFVLFNKLSEKFKSL